MNDKKITMSVIVMNLFLSCFRDAVNKTNAKNRCKILKEVKDKERNLTTVTVEMDEEITAFHLGKHYGEERQKL